MQLMTVIHMSLYRESSLHLLVNVYTKEECLHLSYSGKSRDFVWGQYTIRTLVMAWGIYIPQGHGELVDPVDRVTVYVVYGSKVLIYGVF